MHRSNLIFKTFFTLALLISISQHVLTMKQNSEEDSLEENDTFVQECLVEIMTTKLHYAIETGNLKVAHQCLINKANPNILVKKYTALDQVCFYSESNKELQKKFICLLLNYKADPNGGMCLLIGYHTIASDIIELLLQHKANPNYQEICSKETPLHTHSRKSNYDIIQLLLQHNANPNMKNCSENAPLHVAYENDNFKTIKLLLDCNAQPEFSDHNKQTLLHALCYNFFDFNDDNKDQKSEKLAKLLIKSYLPSEAPSLDYQGDEIFIESPCLLDFEEKQEIINNIRRFISLEDRNGNTALMIAETQKNNLVTFLKKLNKILAREGHGYDNLVKFLEHDLDL